LFQKGGQKFFEKIQKNFVQIKKISQLVREGTNLTNLENRIDIETIQGQ